MQREVLTVKGRIIPVFLPIFPAETGNRPDRLNPLNLPLTQMINRRLLITVSHFIGHWPFLILLTFIISLVAIRCPIVVSG